MKENKNHKVLNLFLEHNELKNQKAQVIFAAIVSIKTSENRITKTNIHVMIKFKDSNNFETLYILDNDLDSNYFPIILSAKVQEFNYKLGEFLIITGYDKNNSAIGNYEIKIMSIENKLQK